MILYANGCSHTAAAEAVNPAAFAEDDGRYYHLGRRPHPDNLEASWCTHLSRKLGWDLVCDAESAGSNDRTIRTTQEWFDRYQGDIKDVFVILQWSTWEREEWLHEGTWYQVNASGTDDVPKPLQYRYRHFVINVDWDIATLNAHTRIWHMHQWMKSRGINHLFYNGFSTFNNIRHQHDWGPSYMSPYDREGSYNAVLLKNEFSYVNPSSYHFGADAHCFWAQHVLQYMQSHNLASA